VPPARRSPATAPRGRGGDLAHRVVAGLLPRVWRTRVTGLEHLPATGPVLLVANHVGLLDGPLVWGLVPRDVRFLVKGEMCAGVLGALLTATRQVPVDRTTGRGASLALALAARVLADGGAVGVFPEGTRGRGDVAQVRSGAAWLALRSRAPVVPVAVVGTAGSGRGGLGALPRPRAALHVALGPPLHLAPSPASSPAPSSPAAGGSRRAALALAAEHLRAALAAHVAAAADGAPPPPPPAPVLVAGDRRSSAADPAGEHR
jgi:1-acyl-sn-glycerol-3-phosphate acyltransferase